jgi:hypothetical protein
MKSKFARVVAVVALGAAAMYGLYTWYDKARDGEGAPTPTPTPQQSAVEPTSPADAG